MRFSNPLLAAHLKTGRIAHTYLFTGPEGDLKTGLVTDFSKSLNCEREMIFEACECLSCRKIEKKIHPDVHWLGEDEKVRSIKIEEIRNLIREAFLKPFEGKWKVFILKGAERLTIEAANALLKTLEEPPEHSVFILLVENKAHLLETIQSRASDVRTPPPPEKDPLGNPSVRAFHEQGTRAFFGNLRETTRQGLVDELGELMSYLKDRAAESWEGNPSKSRRFLEAVECVYKTQTAVDENVNQKLALTYLEIQLGKILK